MTSQAMVWCVWMTLSGWTYVGLAERADCERNIAEMARLSTMSPIDRYREWQMILSQLQFNYTRDNLTERDYYWQGEREKFRQLPWYHKAWLRWMDQVPCEIEATCKGDAS